MTKEKYDNAVWQTVLSKERLVAALKEHETTEHTFEFKEVPG